MIKVYTDVATTATTYSKVSLIVLPTIKVCLMTGTISTSDMPLQLKDEYIQYCPKVQANIVNSYGTSGIAKIGINNNGLLQQWGYSDTPGSGFASFNFIWCY